MKKLISFIILVLCLFALASCGECEHSWQDATCNSPKVCSLCGVTNGSPLEHSWQDATCSSPKTCTLCKKTEGNALSHVWANEGCMTPNTCLLCGVQNGVADHAWIDATCLTPKFCPSCGAQEGEVTGHNFVQISCTQPLACQNCGETTEEGIVHNWKFISCTEPRVCADCDLAESEAPGHQFSEATCTLPSFCTVCKRGKGSPLGHDMQPATCVTPEHCSRCTHTVGVVTGHIFEFTKSIPPSCAEGKDIYTCKNCPLEDIKIKPAVFGYHVCDANGYCSVCQNTYDTSKMALDKVVASGSALTDKCGYFSTPETASSIYKPITSRDIGMPVVELNGNLSSVPKEGFVELPFIYDDGELQFECTVQIRIQGASSAGYAKKNYSIKLINSDGSKHKVELSDGWGKEFKYCMKANWVDYSQARNVVSAQLFGDVIRAREVQDELSDLVNGGAIDGFPIVVYNNGDFLGLYTMNIPKDKWMFDMKDSDEKNQAIVMGDQWGKSVAMKEPITNITKNWTYSNFWELEFASNEESTIDNSTDWVAHSLNNLINFVINNDGQDFIDGISQYADVDKCIDSMIYTFFICADDNVSKNVLWVTYDGTHWFSSMYDMDGTWGLKWNGQIAFNENHLLINNLNIENYNLMWQKLYKNFYTRIVERYLEMRQGPLSYENIEKRFTEFDAKIPDMVFDAEQERWPSVPSHNENNIEQILDFARKRIAKMDSILVYP